MSLVTVQFVAIMLLTLVILALLLGDNDCYCPCEILLRVTNETDDESDDFYFVEITEIY